MASAGCPVPISCAVDGVRVESSGEFGVCGRLFICLCVLGPVCFPFVESLSLLLSALLAATHSCVVWCTPGGRGWHPKGLCQAGEVAVGEAQHQAAPR